MTRLEHALSGTSLTLMEQAAIHNAVEFLAYHLALVPNGRPVFAEKFGSQCIGHYNRLLYAHSDKTEVKPVPYPPVQLTGVQVEVPGETPMRD